MGRLGEEKLFCAKKHCPIIPDDSHEDKQPIPQEAIGSLFSKSCVCGDQLSDSSLKDT